MHLKILIGVLTLGLAAASPKAAAKPAAKASPQYYSGDQTFYVPPNNFGQSNQIYAAQPYTGQPSLGYYDVRYAPSNYGQSSGNPTGVPSYTQAGFGNYYQQPQVLPSAVYSGASGNNVYNGYIGGARLWPKNLVSPTGSPSPVTASPAPLYYPSSTPSPVAYQSTSSYVNSPLASNFQVPVSSPSPVQQYQNLIPVPVKVGSRNSFTPEVSGYNTISNNIQVSPAPYFPKYQQQSTPAPYYQQSYPQPTAIPYTTYQQQSSGNPYFRYQQPTGAPFQPNYYQQYSTPAPYQYNYQSTASPFATYQSALNPYVAQYQKSAVSASYQQPLSPLSTNYQRIPIPVGYPQNQYQFQPTKPALTYSVTPTPSYPTVPVTSKPISVVPTLPTNTVTITEKPYVPVTTTRTAVVTPKATIIKSEYNSGTVSPQINHIPSQAVRQYAYSANPYLPTAVGNSAYGLTYDPSKFVSAYSPSTAVSHVNYNNGLGASYSYKK